MGCAQTLESFELQHETLTAPRATTSSSIVEFTADFGKGFHENYTVEEKLGMGAFAAVYAARARSSNREVAVKVTDLRGNKKADFDDAGEQLQRKRLKEATAEVAVLKLLSDEPHVINLLDSYLSCGLSYLVLERCDLSLYKALSRMTTLTETTLKELLHQMLTSVAQVHAIGIVHCDVKPDNFLVHTDGPKEVVKLCDFGLARQLESSDDCAVGLKGVHGTAPFMAPEMLQKGVYGLKIDTWSLGCVAYTLLLGQFPYMPQVHSASEMKIAIAEGKSEPSYEAKGHLGGSRKTPPLSAAAKAFLKRLLCRKPALRLSAAAAMEEPFWKAKGSAESLRAMLFSALSIGAFDTRDISKISTDVDHRLAVLQKEAVAPSSTADTDTADN